MKVLVQSGYSDMDGSTLFVRDSAFDTAADGDVLICWDTEQGYTYGDGAEFTFAKQSLQVLEYDPEYERDDDIEEGISPDPKPVVNSSPQDNETITSDFKVNDNVLVTARFMVTSVFDGGVAVVYEGAVEHGPLILHYADDNFRDIKLLPRPVEHPAAGSIVNLTVVNANGGDYGQFILAETGWYYGIGVSAGKLYHKKNGDIVKVESVAIH